MTAAGVFRHHFSSFGVTGLLKNKDLRTCGAEVEEMRQLSAVG